MQSETGTIMISNKWTVLYKQLKDSFNAIKNNLCYIKLIEIYKDNKWNEIPQKELYSQIRDEKLLDNEYINTLFNELLKIKVLVKLDPDILIFSKDEFEKIYLQI